MKILFTPFPQQQAGTLANRLEFSERIQVGISEQKRAAGAYRGFKPGDRIYSPTKQAQKYVHTGRLKQFVTLDDQVYINAHCNAGLDFLSTEASCSNKSKKVNVADLIEQLKAHDLPEVGRAKIKLWICKGAIGIGDNRSFAAVFSEAMDVAGFKQVSIFAYTESVFAQYSDIEQENEPQGDRGYHKRAVLPDAERLERAIAVFKGKEIKTLPLDVKRRAMAWTGALHMAEGDEAFAKQQILRNAVVREQILGVDVTSDDPQIATAVVGLRAKGFRKQFSKGQLIG